MVCEFPASGKSRNTTNYNSLWASNLRIVKKHKETVRFVSFKPQESQEKVLRASHLGIVEKHKEL